MAASAVAICNDALILIGAQKINDLSETSKEAVLCNEQYAKARDQLMIAHPWNFAQKRAQLTSLSVLPTGWENNDDFAYAHNLPSDLLRMLEIDDNESGWSVESSYIFTNYTPIRIIYISQVTNTALFSKHFEEALAYKIALKIAYALTQSSALVTTLKAEYEEVLAMARSFDAQEHGLQSVYAEDWLNSRR